MQSQQNGNRTIDNNDDDDDKINECCKQLFTVSRPDDKVSDATRLHRVKTNVCEQNAPSSST